MKKLGASARDMVKLRRMHKAGVSVSQACSDLNLLEHTVSSLFELWGKPAASGGGEAAVEALRKAKIAEAEQREKKAGPAKKTRAKKKAPVVEEELEDIPEATVKATDEFS
jgi:hypothetical protein